MKKRTVKLGAGACTEGDSALAVGLVPASLRAEAIAALTQPAPVAAVPNGRQVMRSAVEAGLDPELVWAVIGEGSGGGARSVLASVMIVPTPGRGSVVFVSRRPAPWLEPSDIGRCIETACAQCDELRPGMTHLHSALVEPSALGTIRALEHGGFRRLTTLVDMVKPIRARERASAESLGGGLDVVKCGEIDGAMRSRLIEAIDASYVDSLDCPELCGLRATADVLDSHMSAGDGRTGLWRLVLKGGRPVGCCLVSVGVDAGLSDKADVPTGELVYLGLAPEARGVGAGGWLVRQSVQDLSEAEVRRLRCSVDERNGPALRLYASEGFREGQRRVAMVRPAGGRRETGLAKDDAR